MKPLPKEARNRNVTSRQFCRWCGDTGYVVVGLRTVKSAWKVERGEPLREGQMDEWGPCPYCEAGFREEYPEPKDGNRNPTRPPWREGFWQGREVDAVNPLYPKGNDPLPLDENARRMRELAEKMVKIPKGMP